MREAPGKEDRAKLHACAGHSGTMALMRGGFGGSAAPASLVMFGATRADDHGRKPQHLNSSNGGRDPGALGGWFRPMLRHVRYPNHTCLRPGVASGAARGRGN